MAMLALRNYLDRSSISITASPSALAGLPTGNLKVPWFDGIARGSSASSTVSFSWELPYTAADPGRMDVVAVLGLNWRSAFGAVLRWWNAGGSWDSPLGGTTQTHYYATGAQPWAGLVPRNVFVPLPSRVSNVRYWRLDVLFNDVLDPGQPWAWEARRLWAGPALRFNMRREPRTAWAGTHGVVEGETAIPNVSAGRTYRKFAFQGRAVPIADVYGSLDSGQVDLNNVLFEKGPFGEAILLPRHDAVADQPNPIQTLGMYGRLLPGFETALMPGNRVDLSGELQEVPHPLPSPLSPPS